MSQPVFEQQPTPPSRQVGNPEKRFGWRFWAVQISRLGRLAIWCSSALLVFSYLEPWSWEANLVCHFRLQLSFLVGGLGLLATVKKSFRTGLVAGVVVAPTLIFFASHYLPLPRTSDVSQPVASRKQKQANADTASLAPRKPQADFSFASINLLCTNQDTTAVVTLIAEQSPDLVAFLEVTPDWEQRLRMLDQSYPYIVSHPLPHAFGIQLRSRLPFEHVKTHWLLEGELPAVEATVAKDTQQLTIIAAHVEPPLSRQQFRNQRQATDELAEIANSIEGPFVLMGDFNTTPFSTIFRTLKGDRIDSRKGVGWHPSWPAEHLPNWIPVWIPIDHAFLSTDVHLLDRTLGPPIGSDHLPLFLKVRAGKK